MDKDHNDHEPYTTEQNKVISETPEGDPKQKSKKKLFIIVAIAAVLVATLAFAGWYFFVRKDSSSNTTNDNTSQEQANTQADPYTPVDLTKLPLGNDKYSTSPQKGYVYSCQTSFNGGGASETGAWINTTNGTWDLTRKISVQGDVSWPQAYVKLLVDGTLRDISSNDLPTTHNTGTFPISASDPAYQIDRNPNSIAAQSISLEVPANPTLVDSPGCVGGEVGIATTGVLIFNAFDAGGRDAVATEVQDKCSGHPQAGDYYHYHGYSDCFVDNSADNEHSDLLGYAYDGFGIFGLKGEGGYEISSADLDECHGHTHKIMWDGQEVEMYHYHFTHDFPYTVSCYRGATTVKALSSGEGGGMLGGRMPPR